MFASPPPPKSAHNLVVESSYNTHAASPTFTNDCSAYRDLFYSATLIPQVIDFANQPADMLTGIWTAIDSTEGSGAAPAIAEPADWPADEYGTGAPFQFTSDLVRAEAVALYAAKIAHMMYHELQGTFPWSIARYPLEWLEDLIGTDRLFPSFGGDDPSTWHDTNGVTIDYYLDAPTSTYAQVSGQWQPAINMYQGVMNLIENRGRDLFHGPTSGLQHITTVAQAFDVANPRYRAAAGGCPGASRLLAALTRALNIPARWEVGYFFLGHHSYVVKPLNLIMDHADNVYQDGTGTKARHFFTTLDWYETNVFPNGRYNVPDFKPTARRNELRKRAQPYGSGDITWFNETIPGTGWPAVVASNSRYIEVADEPVAFDKYYQDLVQLTGNDGGGVTYAGGEKYKRGSLPMFSDDFSKGRLGFWVDVDPVGDCTFGYEGQGTADARSVITVPTGSDHASAPNFQCAYRRQNVSDAYNASGCIGQLEIKIDSPPTSDGQEAGLFFSSVGANEITLRVRHDGTSQRAIFRVDTTTHYDIDIGNNATVWLRMNKLGSNFLVYRSINGTTWTALGALVAVGGLLETQLGGYFAGGDSGSSEYVAKFDYCWETAAPVTNEDVAP